jgi:hypothetical protein
MSDERRDLPALLRAHAEQCDDCATQPLPLDGLARVLTEERAVVTPPSLSRRVMVAAVPLLAANAAYAYRKRLIAGVALAVAPFPLLVFFNLYLLREAYELLSQWLPIAFVAWLVIGYAAALLLICALTYASLPLLIARARARAALPVLESGAYA